jgi:hypothetical protein
MADEVLARLEKKKGVVQAVDSTKRNENVRENHSTAAAAVTLVATLPAGKRVYIPSMLREEAGGGVISNKISCECLTLLLRLTCSSIGQVRGHWFGNKTIIKW